MPDFRAHLLETPEAITALLGRVRTVAVLGIKTADSGAPAHFVPAYAKRAGLRVIPVPVYYPELTELLGEPAFAELVRHCEAHVRSRSALALHPADPH